MDVKMYLGKGNISLTYVAFVPSLKILLLQKVLLQCCSNKHSSSVI